MAEYLLAADLFTKDQFYGRALAIYKQLCRRDPSQVYGKMADIYREKGCLAEAFHQYRILARHYEKAGEKQKALNIVKMIGEIDLQKIDENGGKEIRVIPRGKTEESSGTAEAVAGRGFDLGAALTTAEPLLVENLPKMSVLEEGIGVEEIFKELKDWGGPTAADPISITTWGLPTANWGF